MYRHLKKYLKSLYQFNKRFLYGNFLDPHNTECSNICGTPVLSLGGVLKLIEKTLLSSSFFKYNSLAPVFSCSKNMAIELISSNFLSSFNLKPLYILPFIKIHYLFSKIAIKKSTLYIIFVKDSKSPTTCYLC